MKKKFKAVELNQLDDTTIMKIREWRNQEFVRKMMFNKDIIDEETHIRWIDELKNDTNRYLFVFYLDDEPFGVTQYKYHSEKNAIETGDYLISEDYQLMGYGVIMEYFEQKIVYYHLYCKQIYGEVIEFNTQCVRLNQYMGFESRQISQYENIDGRDYGVLIETSDIDIWESQIKAKLGKIVSKLVDIEYTVIM